MAIFIEAFVLVIFFAAAEQAKALPAFAMREKVPCTICHANGAYPHLTRTGFLYRRAGFRFPADIGNDAKDGASLDMLNHLAAGINIDYQYTDEKTESDSKHKISKNNFTAREAEIWPVVGAFDGNIGAWTEVDFEPATDQGASTASLNQGDLRYIWGKPESFSSIRVGLIAPEGFGASDQWLDDGNIPIFDQISANYNQDTLAAPFGAMETPQMGIEYGYSTENTFVTLGVMNGFSGYDGKTSELNSATVRQGKYLNKDLKMQVDQFILDKIAITASYYLGNINLATQDDTANTWHNRYSTSRLYLTYFPAPAWEVLSGVSYGDYEFVTAESHSGAAGHFNNHGIFAGTLYHVLPHLSVGERFDFATFANRFSDNPDSAPMIRGFGLMASLPYDHSTLVFHANWTTANNYTDDENPDHIAHNVVDLRSEWRFMF